VSNRHIEMAFAAVAGLIMILALSLALMALWEGR
jgi:hypothetical protein